MTDHVVAVDWSGRAGADQRAAIWLAEVRHGELSRLECGRTRDEVVTELRRVADADPSVVIGLDFSFGLPAWFAAELGCTGIDDVWGVVEARADEWLTRDAPPFWGRPGTRKPSGVELFRVTEQRLRDRGLRPSSTFQVGGAGAVGTASLRGMPHLRELRRAGMAIWPFDPPRTPFVCEIWPRLALGSMVKRDTGVRRAVAAARDLPAAVIGSDDALDAALAALLLAEVTTTPVAGDPSAGIEGWIVGS